MRETVISNLGRLAGKGTGLGESAEELERRCASLAEKMHRMRRGAIDSGYAAVIREASEHLCELDKPCFWEQLRLPGR